MCVRTLIPNEGEEIVGQPTIERPQPRSKLTRTKEKCMKIHDEILERDLEMIAQRKAGEDAIASVTSGDILAASTVRYSVLLNLLAHCYDNFQRSRFFK